MNIEHSQAAVVLRSTGVLRRFTLMLALVFAFIVVPAVGAYANNGFDPSVNPDAVSDVKGDRTWLPLDRWMSATESIHYRLDAKQWEDLGPKIQVHTNSLWLNLGNSMWSLTFAITDFAARFDPMATMGAAIDNASAAMAETVLGTPIVVAMLIGVVVMAIWLASKGGGRQGMMQVGKSGLIVALLYVMSAGAAQSTGEGDDFQPGRFSPVWMVNTVSGVVETTSAGLTHQVMTGQMREIELGDPLHCSNYLQALRDGYVGNAGGTVTSDATLSVPMVVSYLWEHTGLEAYKSIQFGENQHADRAFCQLLEYNRGTAWHGGLTDHPWGRLELVKRAADVSGYVGGTVYDPSENNAPLVNGPKQGDLVWDILPDDVKERFEAGHPWQQGLAFLPTNNNGVDRSMIGWAACKLVNGNGRDASHWELNDGWQNLHEPSDCVHWWTGVGGDGTEFDYDDNEGAVLARLSVEHESTSQYVMRLHGSSAAGMTGSQGLVYLLSAGSSLFAFSVPSIAKLVASYALIVLVLLIPIILVIALWPGKADDRIVSKYAKTGTGLIVLTWGFTFVLSIMATIAVMFAKLGQSADLPALAKLILVGLSPLLAWGVISWIFKTLLHSPNPLSVRGALAYGGLAGVAGGVVGGMIARGRRGLSRGGRKAARDVNEARRRRRKGIADHQLYGWGPTPEGVRGRKGNAQSMNNDPIGGATDQADNATEGAQAANDAGKTAAGAVAGVGGAVGAGAGAGVTGRAGSQGAARDVIDAELAKRHTDARHAADGRKRGPLKTPEQARAEAKAKYLADRSGQTGDKPGLGELAGAQMAAMKARAGATFSHATRGKARKLGDKARELNLRKEAAGGTRGVARMAAKKAGKLGVAGTAISTVGIAVGAGIPIIGAAAAYGGVKAVKAGARRIRLSGTRMGDQMAGMRDERVAEYIEQRNAQRAEEEQARAAELQAAREARREASGLNQAVRGQDTGVDQVVSTPRDGQAPDSTPVSGQTRSSVKGRQTNQSGGSARKSDEG